MDSTPRTQGEGRALPAPQADVIRRTAQLARLALSDREVEAITPQFARILGAFEALRALDTEGVEPMTRPIDLAALDRADEAGPCLSADEALAVAPKREGDFYAVPKTLEAEG